MMQIKRGDILLSFFAFFDLSGVKIRPTLVVQADAVQREFSTVLVVPISSRLRRAGHPARILIKISDYPTSVTGLKQDSVIMADMIVTMGQTFIYEKIGEMPDMRLVDEALRQVLGL